MSETYTTGGDTWQPLVGFDISGQTITPLESHIITFIDLDLWLFGYTPPELALTKCDASHEPTGLILAYAHAIEPLVYLPPAKRRVRFQLDTPISLDAGTIYSIWIYKGLYHSGADNQCLYDKDDATYPRGHIIFSDDGGHTWTHFNNHDFIFCEFGDPPLPKPKPVPPIEHFATIALEYQNKIDSTSLTLATSVPCHLTCYYTPTKPRTHHTTRIVRGLAVPWGTYFCFVGWKSVEQTEPGDTLYHTFEVPDWAFCQTKWFTFRGNIDNELSPSVGPIFKHHHSLTLFQHYNEGESSAYRFSTTTWVAQTFTIETTHAISQVRVMLNRHGFPGNVIIGIYYTDDDGYPIHGPIKTATFNGNELIEHPGKEWKTIPIATPALPPGKYALTMRAPEGAAGIDIGWWGDSISPTYEGGNWLAGRYPDGRWSDHPWRDAMFEEWGTPA